MAPPVPAFNKLLELCSKQPDMMDTVHQARAGRAVVQPG